LPSSKEVPPEKRDMAQKLILIFLGIENDKLGTLVKSLEK